MLRSQMLFHRAILIIFLLDFLHLGEVLSCSLAELEFQNDRSNFLPCNFLARFWAAPLFPFVSLARNMADTRIVVSLTICSRVF